MDFLKTLAPTVATMLGGPAAGFAVKWLADKIGVPDATQDAVTSTLQSLGETPEGRIKLAQIDADLRTHAIDAGIDFERLAVANASDINKTMQTEATAEHWASWLWRPSIGLAVAFNVAMESIVVVASYIGVMFCGVKPEVLNYIPAMLGAMAGIIAVTMPVLGVASWFRGKAQADPSNSMQNKG